jgi:hypothetical protein
MGTPVPYGQARAEFRHVGETLARYLIQFPVTMTGVELISRLTEEFDLGAGRWGMIVEEEDDTIYPFPLEPNQQKVIRRYLPHTRLLTVCFFPHPSRISGP